MASQIMFSTLTLFIFINRYAMAQKFTNLEPTFQERAVLQHRTDSLTILMLLGLLLLTILTVWLFKHRRFRFVHETGLSMIYGLIVGAIIRYTSDAKHIPTAPAALQGNHSYTSLNPPDYISIILNRTNSSDTQSDRIIYAFKGAIAALEEPPLERAVTFSPELFFNVMLPVIIFNAGYSMKRKHFFKNLGAILSYALIGTTISALVVGAIMWGLTRVMYDITITLNECFIFGAYLSATDPVTILALFNDLHVDVDLYALVFGESVLNDAVAIVLSESVETYGEYSSDAFSLEAFFSALGKFAGVMAGAFAIGTFMGIITAFLTKFTKIRDFPLLETALFFLMSYSTFQAAEAADLTGIVAVLFCGITQAHYTYNNLSIESKYRTKQLFELMNFLSENFVFLYIGVSIFTFEPNKWHAGFIFATFFAVIVARFLNIYPLSFLLNLGRSNKIRPNFQHMMMFSGLRGAMAFALAIRETDSEGKQLMASATMIIVLSTVILCGGFTTPMLQWLQIRVGVDETDTEMHHMAGESVRNLTPDMVAIHTQRLYSTMANPSSSISQLSTPGTRTDCSMPGFAFPYSGSPLDRSRTSSLQQPSNTTPIGLPSANSPRVTEKAWLVARWYNFDMRFMKPLLTNCRPTLMETLPNCCLPFAKLFTTEEQISQGEIHIDDDSEIDMIIGTGNTFQEEDYDARTESGGQGDTNHPSSHHVTTTHRVGKEPLQTIEDPHIGDLGLGLTNQLNTIPMRVNLPGPKGDRV
ncbi:sodium/hydrogen exchanger 9-like isoform X3 [Biomphalaria glabrata]|uniref:Sodium/hydrogen exchanger n=1 Tax=Biomphalaria glabrata TaxID=6526 RepID=A0A9W2Z096_BIOGL|nr:sodium/hydrogen exchanger 9-like isoform X3 [Biomphalaria glabrata]